MTFGEHLDELRRALIKATLALVIGFLVALLFAGWLVDYVQTPLKRSLTEYYRGLAAKEYRHYLETQQLAGAAVPDDPQAAAQRLADEGLVAEERDVDPHDVLE